MNPNVKQNASLFSIARSIDICKCEGEAASSWFFFHPTSWCSLESQTATSSSSSRSSSTPPTSRSAFMPSLQTIAHVYKYFFLVNKSSGILMIYFIMVWLRFTSIGTRASSTKSPVLMFGLHLQSRNKVKVRYLIQTILLCS